MILSPSLSLFLYFPFYNFSHMETMVIIIATLHDALHIYNYIIKSMFNEMAAVDFRPMLWGMKAVETHSVKKSLGASLSKQTTAEEVMECLDQKTLQTSILKLPLRRKMQVRILWYRISRNFSEDLILALLARIFSSLKLCIANNTSLVVYRIIIKNS